MEDHYQRDMNEIDENGMIIDEETTENVEDDESKNIQMRNFLDQARKQLLENGKPTEALSFVIAAVTLQKGSIIEAERYINKEVKSIKSMYEEVKEIEKSLKTVSITPTQSSILEEVGFFFFPKTKN
jgi:hypothetical protein